jgi:hypothetical protein
MTFDDAMAYALGLPDVERSTSYRQPCAKANGNGFLFVGHAPKEAFALRMDMDTKQIMLETHAETFFETAHYSDYPAILVRYDGPDDDLVREMIGRAADWARDKKPPRPRKTA